MKQQSNSSKAVNRQRREIEREREREKRAIYSTSLLLLEREER